LDTTTQGATDAAKKQATVLAFDFGTRSIGVAVGNTVLRVAQPLTTIVGEANTSRFNAIDALVAEWSPDRLVVGKPLDEDGSAIEMTARADRFARQLASRFRLPVARVDERFTTRAAATALTDAGVRGRARTAALDEVAAQLILQAWFDEQDRVSR
jgi:putative Holliday junction resolvase